MAAVREVTAHFDSARQREFRRFLVFSVLLHLSGLGLLGWMPAFPLVRTPEAIMVNLVAAPGGVRPVPRAAPRPKPKPPKPAPVVLPKEPSLPKPKPREKPAPPEPEAPPEQDYGDVMARLRAELGEPEPQSAGEAAEPEQIAAPAGGGAGSGQLVAPEVARWLRDARIHVRRNWTLTGNFRMQSLSAEVQVDLDAAGNVTERPQIVSRSGNPWYDDGVVRSIQKASPLPPPPEAGTWSFVFTSDEDF